MPWIVNLGLPHLLVTPIDTVQMWDKMWVQIKFIKRKNNILKGPTYNRMISSINTFA